MAFQTDSSSFVNAVELLLGESSSPDRLFRLSKPLPLLLPAGLYYFCSLPIAGGFWIQQLLACWLTAYFLYKILFIISNKKNIAYLGMTAYLLCQPMAVYGLAILVDGMGWCWMVAAVWLILNILDKPAQSPFQLLYLGFFLGLGFFIKESIVMAGIFLFYAILLQKNIVWADKIKAYFLVGIACVSTFVLGNFLVYICWNESLLEWIKFGHDTPPPFSFKNFILQSYHSLDVYWFLIPFGLWQTRSLLKENHFVQSLFLTAITSWILLPFAWPYLYDRILFMNAPFLMLWIAMGAAYFGRWAVPIVVVGGLLNLLVSFGIYKYQIGGLIFGAAVVFLGIVLLAKMKE